MLQNICVFLGATDKIQHTEFDHKKFWKKLADTKYSWVDIPLKSLPLEIESKMLLFFVRACVVCAERFENVFMFHIYIT